jgi:hypothetical protein
VDVVEIRRGSPARYDPENTLTELTESVTAVLGAFGSAVSMPNDGWLRYATRAIQASSELERNHKQLQPCPCRDAYATGEAVRAYQLMRWHARNNNASLRIVAEGSSPGSFTSERTDEGRPTGAPSRRNTLMLSFAILDGCQIDDHGVDERQEDKAESCL